jgi:hypothetical protein
MTAAVLHELKSLLEALRSSLDWTEFSRRFDAVLDPHLNVATALEEFNRYLRTATVKRFLVDHVHNVDQKIGHLGRGFLHAIHSAKPSGNGALSWALKLPLAVAEMREPYDVSFWIAAMTRVISRKGQTAGLVVFWNRNPKDVAPCAIGSWGPGSPNIVRFLVSPNAQDDSWRDIQAQEQHETRLDAPPGPLDQPEASLQQILDYLTITG